MFETFSVETDFLRIVYGFHPNETTSSQKSKKHSPQGVENKKYIKKNGIGFSSYLYGKSEDIEDSLVLENQEDINNAIESKWNNRDIFVEWVDTFRSKDEELALIYDKITLTDLENSVVEGLQIIEPDIERLAFVSGKTGEGRHAVVKMKDNGIYPLSEMGDGINRILHIILSLVNAENGFLLIDEIENGLHYSALEQLWKVIFVLSEKLNVQVFATTHSVDCIQSFALHPDEENKNYFRLDKINGEITVEDYSSEELKIAVQNDIETRA